MEKLSGIFQVAQGQVYYIESVRHVKDDSNDSQSRLIKKSRPWIAINSNEMIRSTRRVIMAPLSSTGDTPSDIPYSYRGEIKFIRMSEHQTFNEYDLEGCYGFTMDEDIITRIIEIDHQIMSGGKSLISYDSLRNIIISSIKEKSGKEVSLSELSGYVAHNIIEHLNPNTTDLDIKLTISTDSCNEKVQSL